MPNILNHSSSDIVRYLLISHSIGTLPSSNLSWPISVNNELDTPDNTITIYDTLGKLSGRYMYDGSIAEHYGIQIRVRSATERVGYQKLSDIRGLIVYDILREVVTIDISNNYCVQCFSAINDILPLGKESAISNRRIFVLNCNVSIKML